MSDITFFFSGQSPVITGTPETVRGRTTTKGNLPFKLAVFKEPKRGYLGNHQQPDEGVDDVQLSNFRLQRHAAERQTRGGGGYLPVQAETMPVMGKRSNGKTQWETHDKITHV